MAVTLKLYNYIYLISNCINGKIYVGKHSTDNLDDTYMGSGRLILKAIKKYGIENFSKEYLAFTDNENSLNYLEKFYIRKYKSRTEFGNYNMTDGGDGSNGFKGRHHTEEAKLKISEKHKGNLYFKGRHHTEEAKIKISEATKGRNPWNKGLTNCYTEEQKKRMKDAYNNMSDEAKEAMKQKMSDSKKGHTPWNKGKHWNEETRKKISESNKGKSSYIRTDEHRQKMSEAIKKSHQRRKEEKK